MNTKNTTVLFPSRCCQCHPDRPQLPRGEGNGSGQPPQLRPLRRSASNPQIRRWAVTFRQGAKPDTDAKVLKAKLSLNWTGPYKVLAVGPCSSADTPDGSPLGVKLLYLDLPSDMPGADARPRASLQRCKPCANPHDRDDMETSPRGRYFLLRPSLELSFHWPRFPRRPASFRRDVPLPLSVLGPRRDLPSWPAESPPTPGCRWSRSPARRWELSRAAEPPPTLGCRWAPLSEGRSKVASLQH